MLLLNCGSYTIDGFSMLNIDILIKLLATEWFVYNVCMKKRIDTYSSCISCLLCIFVPMCVWSINNKNNNNNIIRNKCGFEIFVKSHIIDFQVLFSINMKTYVKTIFNLILEVRYHQLHLQFAHPFYSDSLSNPNIVKTMFTIIR